MYLEAYLGLIGSKVKINQSAYDQLEKLIEHSKETHKFWELNQTFEKSGDLVSNF